MSAEKSPALRRRPQRSIDPSGGFCAGRALSGTGWDLDER